MTLGRNSGEVRIRVELEGMACKVDFSKTSHMCYEIIRQRKREEANKKLCSEFLVNTTLLC